MKTQLLPVGRPLSDVDVAQLRAAWDAMYAGPERAHTAWIANPAVFRLLRPWDRERLRLFGRAHRRPRGGPRRKR